MITDAELSYMAAVIDVQGNIRVMETQGGTLLPRVMLSCPNLALLDYFGSMTGMKPILVKRSFDRHRCSIHCEEAHDHITSVTGRWSVSGAKATVMLAAIEPYIRFQKAETEEALKVGLAAPKKPATPAKMKALGWPIPEEWS